MKETSFSLAAALAITLTPLKFASAQSCLGLPSLANRPANALIKADLRDAGSGVNARVGFGTSSAFGGVGVQAHGLNGFDGGTVGGVVDAGLSFIGGVQNAVQLCPVVSLGYERVRSSSSPSTTTEGRVGVAGGVTFHESATLDVIPFAVFSEMYDRINVRENAVNVSTTDHQFVFTIGVAFQLNRSIIIRPALESPDRGSGEVSIGVAFPLGTR